MTDPLVYNFDGINSAAASITTFVNDMNETLGQVDKTFRDLLQDGWSGPAADAFAGQSQKWHQNADQMAQTLQQLSQKVGNAAVNMQQADQSAAARFG
jgi:WXG100 family type VII secretion target